jgi:hypothetical protein
MVSVLKKSNFLLTKQEYWCKDFIFHSRLQVGEYPAGRKMEVKVISINGVAWNLFNFRESL